MFLWLRRALLNGSTLEQPNGVVGITFFLFVLMYFLVFVNAVTTGHPGLGGKYLELV